MNEMSVSGHDPGDAPPRPDARRRPLELRSVWMPILGVIALVFALRYAKAALIPITLSVFLGYALMPLVTMLKRRARVPEPLGALLAMILLVAVIGTGVMTLQPQVSQLIEAVPKATVKLKAVLHRTSLDRNSAVRRLTTAADEIERVAGPSGGDKTSVAAPDSPLKLRELMWTGTAGLVTGLAKGFVVLALSYFLLISGHDFKRKLVRISGRSLRQKIVTVEILEEIDSQIQRYMLLQVGTSALVGVLIGFAFAAIGLENALFWGVAAGVLHLIPYVGPALVLGGATVFAYLQFPDLDHVLYVLASGAAIVWIVGMVMLPVLTQKMRSLNAVATFVSLILWDWLWGVPGLLLGVPIMMALMAVCERIESMHPIAELLNSEPSRAPVAPATPVAPVAIPPIPDPPVGEEPSRPQESR